MENKTNVQVPAQEEQPVKKTKKFGWKTAGLVVLTAAVAFWIGKRGVKGVGQDIKTGFAQVKGMIPSKSGNVPQAEEIAEDQPKFDNDRRENRQNNWRDGRKYNN